MLSLRTIQVNSKYKLRGKAEKLTFSWNLFIERQGFFLYSPDVRILLFSLYQVQCQLQCFCGMKYFSAEKGCLAKSSYSMY